MQSETEATAATFHGVGVGPGDPELLTLKAHRLISTSPVIAYLQNLDGHCMARSIAAPSLALAPPLERIELPIIMPMSRQRDAANRQYDQASAAIASHLQAGRDVVFLCEGDPLLYGSFAYLHERLATRFAVEIVPGISSIAAASALAGTPLGVLDQSIAVVSGRHDDARIRKALAEHDTVVMMKAGSQRPRLLALLEQAGRLDEGCYIEHIGLPGQRIIRDLANLPATPGPYFSLLLVHRTCQTRPAKPRTGQ